MESQIREIDAGVKESQRALGKEKLKHQEVNSQLDRFHIAKFEVIQRKYEKPIGEMKLDKKQLKTTSHSQKKE